MFRDGHPTPDVVKIDVEGAELAVLRGAKRLLDEAGPMLFLATHGNDMRDACLQVLTDAGYIVTTIGGDDREYIAVSSK